VPISIGWYDLVSAILRNKLATANASQAAIKGGQLTFASPAT